jgi:hypothetical protein
MSVATSIFPACRAHISRPSQAFDQDYFGHGVAILHVAMHYLGWRLLLLRSGDRHKRELTNPDAHSPERSLQLVFGAVVHNNQRLSPVGFSPQHHLSALLLR